VKSLKPLAIIGDVPTEIGTDDLQNTIREFYLETNLFGHLFPCIQQLTLFCRP
jgi:hypothetical protein